MFNAAFTWNQTDGEKHLVSGSGKNQQSDGMGGQQNETCVTMCCYGDVGPFTKNGIKHI